MIARLLQWWRAAFRRGALERDLHDEMQQHLARATDLLVARGMSRNDAAAAARREFGNVPVIQEQARDARGTRAFDELRQDVRYGLRALIRSPGFTAVVVLTLALGVGVNTAIFSMFKVAIQPLQIADAASFVHMPVRLSYADYEFLTRNSRTLTRLNVLSTEWVVLGAEEGAAPQRLIGELVTEDFFATLGGRAAIGRTFTAAEAAPHSNATSIVLSERLWRTRFGADSSIVGSKVRLAGGIPFTVVGVMPRDFIGINRHTPDIWLPVGVRAMLPVFYNGESDGRWFDEGSRGWLTVSGRIATGSTLAAARTEAAMLLLPRIPGSDREYATEALASLETSNTGGISGSEWTGVMLLFGSTLAVLLIACATVTNLMLARATTRRREVAVRLSLGASRGRVTRQLLTESLLLATMAAGSGVLLSWGIVHTLLVRGTLTSLIEGGDPLLVAAQMRPDWAVCGFAILLALLCTAAVGLVPALRATRADLSAAIKDDSAGSGAPVARSRLRSVLVIGQVALTVTLLTAGGLLVRSLVRAYTLDLGFERTHVLSVTTSFNLSGYDLRRSAELTKDIEARLTAMPGVRAVTRGSVPLMQRSYGDITLPGGERSKEAVYNPVRANYFDALGIRILRGRGFTDLEVQQQAPVVVVSATTARVNWPGEDPLGKTLGLSAGHNPSSRDFPHEPFASAHVIGVAADAQTVQLGQIDRELVYIPSNFRGLLVRTDRPARQMAGSIQALLRSIDPNALTTVAPLDDVIATSKNGVEEAQMAMGFSLSIAVLSLVMSIVGLFGLTAYSVAQRTREFGIRVALGADGGSVMGLVMKHGLALVAVGAVLGIAGGVAASRMLRGMLYGLSPLDPLTYVAVAFVMVLVAAAACFIPARRATKVDPMVALRSS